MKKHLFMQRILAWFMLMALTLCTYADNISDNDGSAFITKAEFDSLKNNFQAQIDSYNQSIDSKIDGAIASYLAGIKLDSEKLFKIYGAKKVGTYEGKTCNRFNLIEIDNGHTGTSWPGWMTFWDSINENDAFGLGVNKRWMTGMTKYNDTSSYYRLTAADGVYGILGYFTSSHWLNYKISDGSTSGSGSKLQKDFTNASSDICKSVCAGPISVAFGEPISWVNPYFKLYEFDSDGDLSFNITYIKNGYDYDGPDDGLGCGYNSISHCLNASSSSSTRGCYLNLVRAGTVLQTWDLLTKTEFKWNAVTCTVKAGDTLGLQVYANGSGANSGTYGIILYSDEIPGWICETT